MAALRFFHLLLLRWELASEEAYIRVLRRERIVCAKSIKVFEQKAEALRVRIATLGLLHHS